MTRRGRPPKTGRDEIVAATYALMRERGLARVSTRDIAERAGISEGSVFYHFGDRQGLLKATFEATLRPVWQFAPKLSGPAHSLDDVREVLLRATESIGAFLEEGLEVLIAAQADADIRAEIGRVMTENDYGPQRGVTAIREYLEHARDAGTIDATVDLDAVAYLVISSEFLRAAQPKVVTHDRGTAARTAVVDTVMRLLTPGRPAPPADSPAATTTVPAGCGSSD